MTATTTTTNLSNLPSEDSSALLRQFLKEHGEIEMILPVVIGVFVTTQFKLRGANALLVNLLVASLARQIFTQLKKEQPQALTQSDSYSSTVGEREPSEGNLQSYSIAHAIPGRVRLRLPQLVIDPNFAGHLQQTLNKDEHVNSVRINRSAASIAINYSNQGLSDWELGMRLMNIINTVQKEHQVSQPMSNENLEH